MFYMLSSKSFIIDEVNDGFYPSLFYDLIFIFDNCLDNRSLSHKGYNQNPALMNR